MSYTKEPLFGNYIGIVVNREDPEYRGRVQVWIPHLSNTLHTEWNDELKNKSFKHIHDSGSLDPKLIEELQNVLPWAECAAPIFGGGTSATFNQETGRTHTNPLQTLGTPSYDNVSPLTDPTLKGFLNEANTNAGKARAAGRGVNLSDDWGGRCLTAATVHAGTGLSDKDLITKGTSLFDGNSTPRDIIDGAKRGETNAFTSSGYYGNVQPYVQGTTARLGDQFLAKRSNGAAGHIITCIDDGRISGKVVWASDNVSGVESPEQMIRSNAGYTDFSLIRLTDQAYDKWGKKFGLSSTSEYANDDEPPTKTALDAAEIPGTVVNPAATATSADRTVKDGYSDINLLQRYDALDPNVKKGLYGLGAIESGFNPTEAYSNSNNSYRNYVRYPDGREAEVESLKNLPPGTKTLEVRNRYVKEEYLKNGGNLSAAQKVAGDSGFFQTSGNMNSGGVDLRTGSASEQMVKVSDYIQKNRPDAYAAMVNGDFNTAYKILGENEWPSLNTKFATSNLNGALLASQSDVSSIDKHVKSVGSVVPGDGSEMLLNPVPNFNPSVNNPMLAGDQPSGMFSIPNKGAKVFVFFLGGDIQKPVYFANLLEPETIKKMAGYGSDGFISGKEGTRDAGMLGSGPVSLTYSREDSIDQDGVPNSFASINLQAGGTGVSSTPNNLELTSQGDCNYHVRGDLHQSAEFNVGNFGSINNTATGDVNLTCGIPGKPEEIKKQQEASEKLKKLLNDVQKQKVEEITKNAKSGETVPCPLCSMDYATERLTQYANKAKSLLRLLRLPWFSYAIDVFLFLANLIYIPFVDIVKGQALGECGNPDCKKGQIPSPQKPIEEANKKAMETLVSKQKEIAELEQQLGNGGSYSVTAAKDIIINAGLTMNDAECFATTVNKSVPVAIGTKDGNKSTMRQLAAPNLPGSVYCSPIQFPGGNVIIKGGNSVKIIAGSPGIEFITKGKLVFNSGSLEILTSNGEMVVGSTNHTTLKGKVVTIDAEDGSNGGGINLNAPNTLIKGLSVTGNAGIKGALNVEGELSCKYLNTVAQRLQSDMAGSPDQRIPFSNWALGSCQTNDILNTIRTAITHFLMPGAILTLTNIIKFVMQCYNTILTNTVMEYAPTGLFFGLYAGPIYNWHHNQLEDPKPIHVDYITPKGIYFDSGSGVDSNSSDPGPVPTRARKNGMGMDGGPKSLAGCGGFGNWGNGNTTSKKGKLNSFGLGDVPGFQGTRLSDENVKFEYNKDGSIKVNINNSPC